MSVKVVWEVRFCGFAISRATAMWGVKVASFVAESDACEFARETNHAAGYPRVAVERSLSVNGAVAV